MLKNIKPKSEFSRNVLTLMTGTSIAQAIPIAISPILTRIYTPEDFGIFALFMAIVAIFGAISNGSYEYAIMLPKKNEDAINIFALGLILNISISIILFLIIIVFHNSIYTFLDNKEILIWLYFVPLSVFLVGCFNILNYFNNREKNYKGLAKANIYKSIVLATFQLLIGFFKGGVIGLISGSIASQIVSNGKLLRNIIDLKLFRHVKKVKMIAVSKKYKKYPFVTMPNVILDNIREYGFSILLIKVFSLSIVGQYYLAFKMLKLPISMIGGSISQVLFQKFSITKEKDLYKLVFKYLIKTSLIAFPIFLGIYFFSIDIFMFMFGENWRLSGEIASVLAPWMFLSFITGPLSNIFLVLNRQEIVFFYSIVYALIPLTLLWFMDRDFLKMLEMLTFCMSMVLLTYIVHVISILKKKEK